MEHSFEFSSHHLHNHMSPISHQYRVNCSVQRHWISGSLCDSRNLYHLLHCTHSATPSQRAATSTTMDSRPLRHLCQHWCSDLPAGRLGLYLLPTPNTSYPSDHELEYCDVWRYHDLCYGLLYLRWKENLHTTRGTGEETTLNSSSRDSLLKCVSRASLELILSTSW